MNILQDAWEELQREWEEQEKERERERIRALIQSYREKKAEALSMIGSAEGYLSEYGGWLDKIIRIYEVDNSMIRGQIETEYNRVYNIAKDEKNTIMENYEMMISDAASLANEIDKKIDDLITDLNNV